MTIDNSLLRSLRHRNFRLYFVGQLISMHGTWMQNVAQSWLIYRLTQSTFMLGLVSFVHLAPVLILGPAGGVVADRFPRRALMLAAQALALCQAITLAVLTLGGWVQPWQIVTLALFLGLIQAIEMPARHSVFAEWVPKEDLPNAIALNSSLFNVSRFLGPLAAGVLVAWIGEGWVFLINAVSFLAAMLGLRAIQAAASSVATSDPKANLMEGLRYAWRERPIRALLCLISALSLLATPYLVLMPVFAQEIFRQGPETFGVLIGAVGAGALAAALMLAQRRRTGGLEHRIGIAACVGGIGLCLFAAAPWLGLALLVLPLVGYCLATVIVGANTTIQLHLEDRLRGRIMSLFFAAFMGFAPIGNLGAGALAEVLGVQLTVTLFGVLFFASGIWYQRTQMAWRASTDIKPKAVANLT